MAKDRVGLNLSFVFGEGWRDRVLNSAETNKAMYKEP